jgi:hypothetical protein
MMFYMPRRIVSIVVASIQNTPQYLGTYQNMTLDSKRISVGSIQYIPVPMHLGISNANLGLIGAAQAIEHETSLHLHWGRSREN